MGMASGVDGRFLRCLLKCYMIDTVAEENMVLFLVSMG